ncbi:hypothetical protein KBC55_00040 [Patescibacteria group bacterium]|nr:hypothetical protein [Patescibacteria group bacterium]
MFAIITVTAVCVFVLTLVFSYSVNAMRAFFSRYDVAGVVAGAPQGKTFGSAESGMTTKFSVRLATATGTMIVNCSSTQCASLAVGDEAQFSCYNEWNGFVQPTEVECRFDELIKAAPASTP